MLSRIFVYRFKQRPIGAAGHNNSQQFGLLKNQFYMAKANEIQDINLRLPEEEPQDETSKKILEEMGEEKEETPKGEEKPKEETPAEEPQEEPLKAPSSEKEEESSFQRQPRPVKYKPIHEYTEEKHQWKSEKEELSKSLEVKDKEISDLKQQLEMAKTPQEADDELRNWCQENNVSYDAMKKFNSMVIRQTDKKFSELNQKIQAYEAMTERQKEQESINKELDYYSSQYPEIKEHKDRILEMAFQKGWNDKSVFEIFFRGIKPNLSPDPKKTAEKSKGGAQRSVKVIDYDNITAEDIKKMSLKEFEKYSEHMAKQGGKFIKASK